MHNSIAPGSSADINVKVTALTTNPNVPVTYKTIILKKNLVNGVNTLTQEMMSVTNTKYVIKYNYVLGENITVPENCILEFDGGTIDKGAIIGDNTILIHNKPIDEVCLTERKGTFIYNTAIADEEDITSENGNLKFKDRLAINGMGKKILRKNIAEGKNILTQDMINQPNTIYEIRYDYDLNGQEIIIPENCILNFIGGSMTNGTINTNNDLMYIIQGNTNSIFDKTLKMKSSVNSTVYFDWYKNTKWSKKQYTEYFNKVNNSEFENSLITSNNFQIETNNDEIIRAFLSVGMTLIFGYGIYPFNKQIKTMYAPSDGDLEEDKFQTSFWMNGNNIKGQGREATCLLFSGKGIIITNDSFNKFSHLCITSVRQCISFESSSTFGSSFNDFEYLHLVSIKDSCFLQPKQLDNGNKNKNVPYANKFHNLIITPGENKFGIAGGGSTQGLLFYIQDYAKNFVSTIKRHYKAMFYGWMNHIQNFSCTYGIECDYIVYIEKDTYIAFAEITFSECHIETNVPLLTIGDSNKGNMSVIKVNINNCRIYSNNSKEHPIIIGGRLKFNSIDFVGNIYVDCTTVLENNSNAVIYNKYLENDKKHIILPFTNRNDVDLTALDDKTNISFSNNSFDSYKNINRAKSFKLDLAILYNGYDKGNTFKDNVISFNNHSRLYCSDYNNFDIKKFCSKIFNMINSGYFVENSLNNRYVTNWSKYILRIQNVNNNINYFSLIPGLINIHSTCKITNNINSTFSKNIITRLSYVGEILIEADTGYKYIVKNLGDTGIYYPNSKRNINVNFNNPYYRIVLQKNRYFIYNNTVYIYSGPIDIDVDSVNAFSGRYNSSLSTEELNLTQGFNDIIEDGDITWTCAGKNAIINFLEGIGDARYRLPTENIEKGAKFYDTNSNVQLYYNGTNWVTKDNIVITSNNVQNISSVVKLSGKFSNKPTAEKGAYIGQKYFCTDKQTAEGLTNGIMIYHKGNDVWVDALGRVVS